MTSPDEDGLQPLERERERIITLLSRHFANDGLSLDDLEARLELAYRASSVAEVRALAADLPNVELEGGSAPVAMRPAPAPSAMTRSSIFSLMSSTVRRGVWVPPQYLLLDALMSDTKLDLREAQLSAGVTEIHIRAIWASVRIIVPPEVHVVSEMTAFMASVSDRSEHRASSLRGAPVLRITGWAVMADVAIRTRNPDD